MLTAEVWNITACKNSSNDLCLLVSKHERSRRRCKPSRNLHLVDSHKAKQNKIKTPTLTSVLFLSSLLSADNVYRKCLANGTWALKGNYSMCKAILHEEVRRHGWCLCACVLSDEAPSCMKHALIKNNNKVKQRKTSAAGRLKRIYSVDSGCGCS